MGGGRPDRAAVPGTWFQFGFRFGAAAAGLGPEPLAPDSSVPGLLVVLRGGLCDGKVLPQDCLDLLPSETQVLLLRKTALEVWPVNSVVPLDGQPVWQRELQPEEATSIADLPLVPGGYVSPRLPFFTPLSPSLKARKLALGHEHMVLLGAGGAVFTWGCGRHGQLGHGHLESVAEPQLLEALQGVPMADVAAGGWHSASISDIGDLYTWGWNDSGQLALPSKAVAEGSVVSVAGAGRGGEELEDSPRAVFISIQAFPALLDMPEAAEVSKVSCGSRHTAAVTRAGELYTWGWGKYGQLGHKDRASCDQPRRVCYFVDQALCVMDVVCGPWTTYVQAVASSSCRHPLC